MNINRDNFVCASSNARIFKPISIFVVVFGHFYSGSKFKYFIFDYWWNLSAMALVYFSITSAYFTNIKYFSNFNFKEYWKNKILRLGVSLFVLNMFLMIIFLLRGQDNVFSTHSLVHFFGLSGFLNWFGIKNNSPFGAGLWFLTLLIIFYLFYPFLRELYKKYHVFCITLSFCLFFVLADKFNVLKINHTLFLTSCGFIIGMYLSIINVRLNFFYCFLMIVILLSLFLFLNFFKINHFNGIFVVSIPSIFFVATMKYDFDNTFLYIFKYLDGIVLEIFVIHFYLFYFGSNVFFINMFLSFSIIISMSAFLKQITRYISQKLFIK